MIKRKNWTENQLLSVENKRKEYVTQLEQRVDDLENEVHSLKRKLRFYEQNEKLNSFSQKENILQYLSGKYEEYDRLDALIKEYEEKDKIGENLSNLSKQLDEWINTIQLRQGSYGWVRYQTVNYLLK